MARHRAGEKHDERLWALINFEIWQRRFFDGDVTPDAYARPVVASRLSAKQPLAV